MNRRIISLLVAFVICISVSPVCYADSDGVYISKTSSYWDTMLHGIVNGTSGVFLLSSGIQGIASFLNGDICALSSDGYHYADSLYSDHVGAGKDGAKYAEAICKFCGEHFLCYASDIPSAYDDYVATLPASGYNSDGSILWSPKVDYWYISAQGGPFPSYYCPHYSGSDSNRLSCLPTFDCSNLSVSVRPVAGSESFNFNLFDLSFSDVYPIDGYYIRIASPSFSLSGVYNNSSPASIEGTPYSAQSSAVLHYAGIQFSQTSTLSPVVSSGFKYVSAQVYPPVYKVTPFNPPDVGSTYNINTRPTSITGGNYGIVGDNGQITKVENNSTIVNETNNTYYNPATGQTVPITGWSYDYSDRSYKVTMEGGKTSTITYGDENISITEITVNESGDTVTNNYTIYYLIGGSGSETPPCDHTWAETSTTPATCTVPGSKLSTCSKCQQTKRESIPALGHDWQVKQTVTTEYDEAGQLTQQGYTIFECSRCHEQYKSPDGTLPPGGSGTGPGGEEKETIWQKIGNFIGSLGGGIVGLIEAALGKILDALIALAEKMMEKLKTVVETILSIFDELPALFDGFLDFLVALFPFLPAELMAILTFGVIAIVFIGIIKAVRR